MSVRDYKAMVVCGKSLMDSKAFFRHIFNAKNLQCNPCLAENFHSILVQSCFAFAGASVNIR